MQILTEDDQCGARRTLGLGDSSSTQPPTIGGKTQDAVGETEAHDEKSTVTQQVSKQAGEGARAPLKIYLPTL